MSETMVSIRSWETTWRTQGTAKNAGEQEALTTALLNRLRGLVEEAPCVFSCAHCDWTQTAPLADGRAAFTEHRKEVHPEIKERLPKRRSLILTPSARAAAAAA